MSSTRNDRKEAIRALVREQHIRNQAELVDLLKERGFDVVRTTVSRDVADMGLVKGPDGTYLLSEDLRLVNAIKTQVIETRRAGNQLIVLTHPGAAQGLCALIDGARLEGALGTIAGDDTILIIAQDEQSGEALQQRIDELIA